MLFIDARQTYQPIDSTHRDFSDQREFLANIVPLYRGEEPEFADGENALVAEHFADGAYADVTGLIEAHGWSFNPGRYVGTVVEELDDEVFAEKLAAARAELHELDVKARELCDGVDHALEQLLEGIESAP